MDLKQLKQIWKENDFRPRKRLGQNFLIDKNIRDNILKALPLDGESVVVEIGAGFGVMSLALADICGRLYAVEKDGRVFEIMEPFFARKDNAELIKADILEVDVAELTGIDKGITVFGNIPYYISTPIIEKMIEQRDRIEGLYIVMQEDLADRIIASPGSRAYGSLSCYVQFHTGAEKILRVKKNCFYPRPQVDSCLLGLKVREQPRVNVGDEKLMFDIIHKAFWQRRKKIINPLSSADFPWMDRQKWKDVFRKCGIDPAARAETLSLEDYARLADEAGALRQT